MRIPWGIALFVPLLGCQRGEPVARPIAVEAAAAAHTDARPQNAWQPTAATQLSVGLAHGCARMRDGSVWCWGENDKGQLGDGTTTRSQAMVQVRGIEGAEEVVAGFYASCARLHVGSVWCWGGNPHGELGDGSQAEHRAPVRVAGVERTSGIALGVSFGCALIQDGTVRCWGSPRYENPPRVAEPVPQLNNVTRIASSFDHACAVRADGTLWCWGSNMSGQLGYGATEWRRSCSIGPMEEWVTPSSAWEPRQVPALQDVTDVALGAARTCALRKDGSVWCSTDPREGGKHTPAVRLKDARQLAVFWPWQKGVVCGVLEGGEVHCEGINDRGQTGSETLDGPFDYVERTARVRDVAELRMGRSSACARTNAGEVWCWALDDAPTFAQKIAAASVNKVTR